MKSLFPLLCAAALLAAPAAASAGALEIGPVSISLVGKERTTTLQVRNPSAEPLNVQIRAMDWTQAGGQDSHTPSQTLVASPPSFTVPPGEAQTVRLVVSLPANPKQEQAWRLVVDQLPPGKGAGASGIQVPIRALVPVFLSPSLDARPSLAWSATRGGAGLVLTVSNSGPVRERLTGLQLTSGGASVGGTGPLFGYVLSGASRSWTVPSGAVSGPLSAQGDGAFGPVKADLSVTN
jgi:fimbrial chaperone protein